MRDSQVVAMQQTNARRDGLLARQFQFLKTRQEAFEAVLKASTWSNRLRWFVWPETLLVVVDAVQIQLLQDEQVRMEAAVKAAAAKPSIQVVSSLA